MLTALIDIWLESKSKRFEIHDICFIAAALFVFFLLIWQPCRGQLFVNVASELGVSALPQSINFGSGLSFYDFDNDGLDDLTFTMTNDSIRFYRNTGDGFELLPSFIYAAGESKCVLWVDYDNDGDLDLLLTINGGRHILYKNDGNFNFTDVSIAAGLFLENERYYGASFADYDKDGYLDFYVCVYAIGPGPVPAHSTNRLYHNNGDGTFTDVSVYAGVDDGVRLSFQSVWFDYDDDTWLDLFVINDRLHANSLYKNNGDGTFTDVSAQAAIQFAGQDPMSASVADFDGDGDFDFYFTNTGVPNKLPKLLMNNGNGTFSDKASFYQVTVPHWSWGATWADLNNNGLQDLYVTTSNPSQLTAPVQNFVFLKGLTAFSSGNYLFAGNHISRSYAVARGDFNNDGYYDLAVLNQHPHDIFLWKNPGGSNTYIKLTLRGTISNSFAIGSLINVYAGGTRQLQLTMCGENYLSQNSQHHIFGLSQTAMVDSVVVIYPSGHSDTYYDLPANASYTLTEGDTYRVKITATPQEKVCAGQSVVLSASEGHLSYLWNTGSTNAGISTDSSGTFVVQTVNQFGVTATDTLSVTVHPLPDILTTIINATCDGEENGSILLQNLTEVPALQVNWSNGASGESLENVGAGLYTFEYTDVEACSASATIEITAPSVLELIIFTQDATDENNGELLILASGGTQPYELMVNNAAIEGNALTGLAPGEYQVLLKDANECMISESVAISSILNSTQIEADVLQLYPNPASGSILLSFGSTKLVVMVHIMSLDGKILVSEIHNLVRDIGIDYNLPSGTYLLVAETDRRKLVKRFIHQK